MNVQKLFGLWRKPSYNEPIAHCEEIIHKNGYPDNVFLFFYLIQFAPNFPFKYKNGKSVLSN